MSSLHKIVTWTQENGDERASARLKMLCLGHLIEDGVKFDEIDSNTECSRKTLDAVRDAAEQITKQECPY